jgi:hypothetical protein
VVVGDVDVSEVHPTSVFSVYSEVADSMYVRNVGGNPGTEPSLIYALFYSAQLMFLSSHGTITLVKFLAI